TGTTACTVPLPHHRLPSPRTSYDMACNHTTRPVVYKPTWWHPTFASRTAQAPAAPSKPYQLDAGDR
ncbi:hypothetical protein C8Q74DRAFT_1301570, partial [Fomes fomentarius]